jgi:hypothetical protein
MNEAVINGEFTNYLVAASIQLNSTATSAASVSSISISAPIIEINGTTLSPTSTPTQSNLKGHVTKKKNFYYLINASSAEINAEDIQILIVNNN